MKKIMAGFLTAALLFTGATAYAGGTTKAINAVFGQVSLVVNGLGVDKETLLYDGTTYVPLRAVADILDMEVGWDGETSTASLTSKPESELKATLSDHAPVKNSVTVLSVTGEQYKGLPYVATVKYKTVSADYEGIVGEPCEIKVSTATPDFKVYVCITVFDEKNKTEYELITSFTPPEQG